MRTCFNNFKKKYNKTYNNLHYFKNKTIKFLSLSKSVISIYSTYLFYNFFSYLNGFTTEKKGKQLYDVHYTLNNNHYTFRVDTTKHNRPLFIQAISEDGTDVTSKVNSYYGPDRNWHSSLFRPIDFDCKSITFLFATGEERKFVEEEYIILD